MGGKKKEKELELFAVSIGRFVERARQRYRSSFEGSVVSKPLVFSRIRFRIEKIVALKIDISLSARKIERSCVLFLFFF